MKPAFSPVSKSIPEETARTDVMEIFVLYCVIGQVRLILTPHTRAKAEA